MYVVTRKIPNLHIFHISLLCASDSKDMSCFVLKFNGLKKFGLDSLRPYGSNNFAPFSIHEVMSLRSKGRERELHF